LAETVEQGEKMTRRRLWWVAALMAAAGVVVLAAGLMTSPSSNATDKATKVAKGESESRKAVAGNGNEGPAATYEAEQESQRAYPADSVPLLATQNSIATFSRGIRIR